MHTHQNSIRPARRWTIALAFVVLVAVSNVVDAATVQGRLIFKNGAPASDVGVRLTIGRRVMTSYAYSVRDGRYFLKNVPAGTYTLEIWRNRAMVASQALTVAEPAKDAGVITLP